MNPQHPATEPTDAAFEIEQARAVYLRTCAEFREVSTAIERGDRVPLMMERLVFEAMRAARAKVLTLTDDLYGVDPKGG